MNKNPYLKIIILTIIFGLGAGIVGHLLSAAYLLPTETFIGGTAGKIKQQTSESEENQKILEAHEEVAPAIIEIYPQKTSSAAEALSQIYLSRDRVALGTILTSDGWLVSFGRELVDPKNNYVIITADQKIFNPEKIILDDATGAVFIKIDAQNMPIPKLGVYGNLLAGEKTIIPLDKQSFIATQIENPTYEKINEPKDLVRSSEKFSKSILIKDEIETNKIGAPLVNLNGEVVGIMSNEPGAALPIDYWQTAFLATLKNDKVVRPYLGISYLNLAKTPGLSEALRRGRLAGAMIWSDNNLNVRGVTKNSPAEKAGLQNEDIILKINDEEITAKTDLVEIIQEYSPGDKIVVTIFRNEKEEIFEIKLEEKL